MSVCSDLYVHASAYLFRPSCLCRGGPYPNLHLRTPKKKNKGRKGEIRKERKRKREKEGERKCRKKIKGERERGRGRERKRDYWRGGEREIAGEGGGRRIV